MLIRTLFVISACVAFSLAQEITPVKPGPPQVKDATAAPIKPTVTKLDDTRYQIGGVVLDRKNREIRFPAKVNMAEGLIEYMIILQKGKVHEALLTTTVVPTDLNLAFLLLRYPPSPELFSQINETGHPTGLYPVVPAPVRAAARITMEVEWSDNGTTRRVPMNEWLRDNAKDAPLAPGPWLYTGSSFSEGKFIPNLSGDIASIKLDSYAMINYPGADNEQGVVWFAFPKRVPPVGTNVTVIITPYFKNKPLPAPLISHQIKSALAHENNSHNHPTHYLSPCFSTKVSLAASSCFGQFS